MIPSLLRSLTAAETPPKSAKSTAGIDPATIVPPDFPEGIEVAREVFTNWARSTVASNVLTCHPKTEEDCVRIANWAADRGWQMRAVGIKHNWSPITIISDVASNNVDGVVLVSLMKHMRKVEVTPAQNGEPPKAKAQLGVQQLDFLTALEEAPGNGTKGYGLMHTPAPDSITLGGMLAINGHGSAVPTKGEAEHVDPKTACYGTYSNRMLSCRAIVYDEGTALYVAKEFKREDDSIAPFLCHVGRAFLTEATLQVDPNYYMRCQSHVTIPYDELFPKLPEDGVPRAPIPKSLAHFLSVSGRVELIWFPFTKHPWLKVWTVTGSKKPPESRHVRTALNYPFSDVLPASLIRYLRAVTGDESQVIHDEQIQHILRQRRKAVRGGGSAASRSWFRRLGRWCVGAALEVSDVVLRILSTPYFTPLVDRCMWLTVLIGLLLDDAEDIWGLSKNTLVYVRDSTLPVTANGYVVATNEEHVEECMYEFAMKYREMLEEYGKAGKYPVSMPLEIRATALDETSTVGYGKFNAQSPPLSATSVDDATEDNKWTIALWLDVLSVPGSPDSNEFYAEMEDWFMTNPTYSGSKGRIRPEWSKGWGYTVDRGAWEDEDFRNHARAQLPRWNEMIEAYERYDPRKLFTNPWMDRFFVEVDDVGAPLYEFMPSRQSSAMSSRRSSAAPSPRRASVFAPRRASQANPWTSIPNSPRQTSFGSSSTPRRRFSQANPERVTPVLMPGTEEEIAAPELLG